MATLVLDDPGLTFDGGSVNGVEINYRSAGDGWISLHLEEMSPAAHERQVEDLRREARGVEELEVRGQPALLLEQPHQTVVIWLDGGDTSVQLRASTLTRERVGELLAGVQDDEDAFRRALEEIERAR